MDHVLIVSRTCLPINFYGLRDSIFDDESQKELYGTPFYGKTLPNETLERWVYLQLQDLISKPPRTNKGQLAYFKQALPIKLREDDKHRNNTGKVFISYRNTGNASLEVDKLARCIRQGKFHNQVPTSVRYFPPDMLSNELMTEQRRWQLLSYIDRFIGPADEVWIYETDDYYNSWWTLGELMTLAYRQKVGYRKKAAPKIKVFKVDEQHAYDAPEDYLPFMTKKQCERIARLYSNCDTGSIAPESIIKMRVFRELPLVKRTNYVRDYVWSKEFWENPILDCKYCRSLGNRANKFDVDEFIRATGTGFFRLSASEITEGSVKCPECMNTFTISQGKVPLCVWIPPIRRELIAQLWVAHCNGSFHSSDNYSLVTLPTYYIKEK